MQETDKITDESLSEEEKKEVDFDKGEKEADVYTEEGIEHLQDEGELSSEEAGFMEGEIRGGKKTKCAACGKVLDDENETVVEKEVKGEVYRFCCEECATKFQVNEAKQ